MLQEIIECIPVVSSGSLELINNFVEYLSRRLCEMGNLVKARVKLETHDNRVHYITTRRLNTRYRTTDIV